MEDVSDHRDALLDGAALTGKVDRLVAALQQLGYPKTEARILLTLNRYPGLTDRELGTLTAMSSAHMSRIMTAMIDKGFVNAEASPRHQRQRLLSLTKTGSRTVGTLIESRREVFDRVVAGLSAADRSLLRDMMIYRRSEARSLQASRFRAGEVKDSLCAFDLIFRALPTRSEQDFTNLAHTAHTLAVHIKRFPSDEHLVSRVATDSTGEPIGFCLATRGSTLDDETSDDAEIMLAALYVTPASRRQGIASKLLGECLKIAQGFTYSAVSIDVPERHPELTAFLKAHQFIAEASVRRLARYPRPKGWTTYNKTLNWTRMG